MENLQTLVRNLAIIILLASFMEMLLPPKSMQGFVKLVMGLFVISAVLGPVTTLLHLPMTTNVPAWTEVTPKDLPVLAGNEGLQIGRDTVQEQFKLILKHQIEALALGITGVENVDVEVTLGNSSGGLTDQPRVERVDVGINLANTEIQTVQPITIGEKEPQTQTQSGQAQNVKEKIAALLQINPDKIFVTEK